MTDDALLGQYHLLGRTGLRVSPLALGAMTFGEGGWHAGEDTARSIFLRYLEAGGNFVDTAINYSAGPSCSPTPGGTSWPCWPRSPARSAAPRRRSR